MWCQVDFRQNWAERLSSGCLEHAHFASHDLPKGGIVLVSGGSGLVLAGSPTILALATQSWCRPGLEVQSVRLSGFPCAAWQHPPSLGLIMGWSGSHNSGALCLLAAGVKDAGEWPGAEDVTG